MKRTIVALAAIATLSGCASRWTFGVDVDRVPEHQCTASYGGRFCLATIWLRASRPLE